MLTCKHTFPTWRPIRSTSVERRVRSLDPSPCLHGTTTQQRTTLDSFESAASQLTGRTIIFARRAEPHGVVSCISSNRRSKQRRPSSESTELRPTLTIGSWPEMCSCVSCCCLLVLCFLIPHHDSGKMGWKEYAQKSSDSRSTVFVLIAAAPLSETLPSKLLMNACRIEAIESGPW